jgi:hypothetical protein
MADQNLEDLSTKEIDVLYKKTLAEAQKQRGFAQAQFQASSDLGLDHEFHKDQFGNIVEGPRPTPKQTRHYVSPEGYVVDLKEGEKAPVSQGTTLLDKVTAFINSNPDDPDLKELLPEDLSVFEEQSSDFPEYILVGTMGRGKWRVTAVNQEDASGTFKFVLGNDLERERAIAAAERYLESRVGPKFRELIQKDINLIQRTAVTDRNEAMLLYLRSRLPLPWSQELESLIVQSDITGSVSRVLEYVSKPEINEVLEEAIFNVFFWNKPHIEPTEELKEFLQQRTANIVLTFPVLDNLLKQYQTSKAVNQLGSQSVPAVVTEQELNTLSDDEVVDLFNKTRVARSRR